MKAVVQRVCSACVETDGKTLSSIGNGLVILLGIAEGDSYEDVRYLADKVSVLRIFQDEAEKMNLSALDVKADILVVSQFTLYADCSKGRRPGFTDAAEPKTALMLYETFVVYLKELGLKVLTGEFGAHMLVRINNDGPVTLLLNSEDRKRR
jgi:D-tyrosyl-tRNA(Tyr) deacylase